MLHSRQRNSGPDSVASKRTAFQAGLSGGCRKTLSSFIPGMSLKVAGRVGEHDASGECCLDSQVTLLGETFTLS